MVQGAVVREGVGDSVAAQEFDGSGPWQVWSCTRHRQAFQSILSIGSPGGGDLLLVVIVPSEIPPPQVHCVPWMGPEE